jgi:hypothetical protein
MVLARWGIQPALRLDELHSLLGGARDWLNFG